VGGARDPPCLAQDHLDLAGVAVPALGEGDGLGTRLDGCQVDDRALGLRDDLLGDDEDVVGSEREDAGRSFEGVAELCRQVVARPDLGDAAEGDDLDPPIIGRRWARLSGHQLSRS